MRETSTYHLGSQGVSEVWQAHRAVIQPLSEHMNIKTTFCSASQVSLTVISAFPGRDPNRTMLAADGKVKSLFVSTASPFSQGMGHGTSATHFPLLWNRQLWSVGWPHGVFFCYFINRWHWSLQHLYSEILPSALVLRLELNRSPRVLLGLFPIFIPRLLWSWQGCTRWRNEPGSHLPFTRCQEIWTENKSMT